MAQTRPGTVRAECVRALARVQPGHLLVSEIFYSLQGESTYAGLPCVFVRLAGCQLRCTYCDTRHAWVDGQQRPIADVVEMALAHDCPLVEITGGEPLLQEGVFELMTTLADRGRTVLLETGGSIDVARVDPRVIKIMDLKCPSSGECARNRFDNLHHLSPADQIKFVIGTRDDYEWASATLREHSLPSRCTVLMGVVFGRLEPRRLAEWILEDRLPVRFQLQMHKHVWPPDQRGV